ncbi:MAG TPA: HAMP domain-containing protein, partial [Polyangiaceae bacterium]|nr:HAMP domain-containing protein [Polyangiaceae bacterium]
MPTKNNGDTELALASRNGRNGEMTRRAAPAKGAPSGRADRHRKAAPPVRAGAATRKRGSVKDFDEDDPAPTYEEYQELLHALRTLREGDFSVRLPLGESGTMFELASTFNEVAHLNDSVAREVVRIGRVVGREGRMNERATLRGAKGAWASKLESINSLILDLVRPSTEVARVITAVAEGDLSQKMALEIEGKPVRGEFLRIGETVNTMVDQL